MKYRVLALFAAAVCLHAAGEFDHLTKSIESHYGVKRTHIPLMGVANLFVKVAHPAGARGFKLAVFEDLDSAHEYGEVEELDRFIEEISHGRLHRMMTVHSHQGGESTYVLTGEIGKTTKMLIANFSRNEATVVEVDADMDTLIKTIGSPEEARRYYQVKPGSDHEW